MPDNATLTLYVSLLIGMSVATERLVEILKGAVPQLYTKQADRRHESLRCIAVQLIAVACGALTALLAKDFLPPGRMQDVAGKPWGALGLGLLLSGGSGFWNSILTYLVGLKDLQKQEAAKIAREVAAEPA